MDERVRAETGRARPDDEAGDERRLDPERQDVRDVQLGRADLPGGERPRPGPRVEDVRAGGPVAAPPPTVRAQPAVAAAPDPTESATLPIAASIMPGTPGGPRESAGPDRLLSDQKRDDLRQAWLELQSSFIDEPQEAVRKADGLVQELLRSVSERFDSARRDLEGEWQRGDGVNTESLRLAFRRYRGLFDRLLSF